MHNQIATLSYGTGSWWEVEHLPIQVAVKEADMLICILTKEAKPANMLWVDEKNPLARWEANGWFVQVELKPERRQHEDKSADGKNQNQLGKGTLTLLE